MLLPEREVNDMKWSERTQVGLLLACVSVICASASSSESLEQFAELQHIAEDHTISYKEAVPRMEALFGRLDDPQIVKAVMLLSREGSESVWAQMTRAPEGENGPSEEWYRFKAEWDRYDEAVCIGMCRLVQIGTSESIKHLVDLTSHYLGETNCEILLQRITEVGEPALEHLRSKLREQEALKEGRDEGGEEQAQPAIEYWAVIGMLEDCIAFIEKGEILYAPVEPCPPSYDQ
ncbi:hypothetical protein AMJ82_10975 [candidate division TA06 bacterium SM23_40]|uniref:Uncharacterized protein n=1 Tax=candidate division TA06 bacterium SM23_40 TaxID=1703774 RepID=A0A0S8G5U0_UNCT6|nr:MAG: hypothetical protein AMJ82_10975 [candidate division TA06 bacterium SM23_40]